MSTPPLFPLFFVVWVHPDSEVKVKWMGWFTRLCTWTASDIFHSFQSSLEAFITFLPFFFFHSLTCTYIALSDRVIISIKGVCLFTSSKWCQTKMQPSAQLSVVLQPLRECSWQHLSCSLSSIYFLISCSSLHHSFPLRSGCMSHFPTAFIPTQPISFSFFFFWTQSVINYVLGHVVIPGHVVISGNVIYYPIHLGKVGHWEQTHGPCCFLACWELKFPCWVLPGETVPFRNIVPFFLFPNSRNALHTLQMCKAVT